MIEIVHNKIGKPKFYAKYTHNGQLFTGYGDDTISAIHSAMEKVLIHINEFASNAKEKIEIPLDQMTLYEANDHLR